MPNKTIYRHVPKQQIGTHVDVAGSSTCTNDCVQLEYEPEISSSLQICPMRLIYELTGYCKIHTAYLLYLLQRELALIIHSCSQRSIC